MKEFTMVGIQKFYCDIQHKLSGEELDRFRYLIDAFSWSSFRWCKDKNCIMDGAFYSISLIDGSEFGDTFKYNEKKKRFETVHNIRHPQVIVDGKLNCISEKIVKYIR